MIRIKEIMIKFPKWSWWQYLLILTTIVCLFNEDLQSLKALFQLIITSLK